MQNRSYENVLLLKVLFPENQTHFVMKGFSQGLI